MKFQECKELTVALLKSISRIDAITLCREVRNYIIVKGNTTGYSFTRDLKENCHLLIEDDEVLPEHQKRIVIYQVIEKPICVIVQQPVAILKEISADFERYFQMHSQEEIDNLTANESDLSFYSLVQQINLLVDSNNDAFSRAGMLLHKEQDETDTYIE